jgi:site-specific DNA-methyltransferase (adenine-specific)
MLQTFVVMEIHMTVKIFVGDCLESMKKMDDGSVNCCVTSPPYFGLRDYGHKEQIGLEQSPEKYVGKLVEVFREVRRVLKDDGTLWLNLGDSYARSGGGVESKMNTVHKMKVGQKATYLAGGMQSINKVPDGLKSKDLVGIPWRVAFALQADGWYLRQDIIWHKPNPMPESVNDRCTKAHEYIFLLSKKERYFYDRESIREPIKPTTDGKSSVRRSGNSRTRSKEHWGVPHEPVSVIVKYDDIKGANKRSVWTVPTKPFKGAHFATFPPDLIQPCILAGCPVGGTVLDPFGGAGTTALVSERNGRNSMMCELNSEYAQLAFDRIKNDSQMFSSVEIL